VDEASIIRMYGKEVATGNAKRKTRWNIILSYRAGNIQKKIKTLKLRIMRRMRLRVTGS